MGKYYVRLTDAEGNVIGDPIAVTDATVFPRTKENDDAYALNAPMCRVALCEELQMAIRAHSRKKI